MGQVSILSTQAETIAKVHVNSSRPDGLGDWAERGYSMLGEIRGDLE